MGISRRKSGGRESADAALARELKEELGAMMQKSVPIGRTVHKYAATPEDLEILFYAVEIGESKLPPGIRTNCLGATQRIGSL